LLDLAATIKHHFPTFFEDLNALPDYRKRKEYEMYEIVFGNLLIFLTRSGSRNQFDLSVNQNMADTIFKLFDVKLSIGDNLDKVISRLSERCLSELKVKMIKHLITKKRLDHLRFNGHFLLVFDGTGLYHYDYEPFEGCPYKVNGDTKTYYAQVLEAKLVGKGGWSLSIATEWLHNGEDISPKNKQDCELKAFKRLSQKVKDQFKRLPVIMLADGLYANDPVFTLCQSYGWNYLFTFKKGCIPQIYQDVQSILSVQQDRFEIEQLAYKNEATQELIAQKANFITAIEYKKHKVNWIDFTEEIRKEGEDWREENHFTYLTNLKVSKSNVFELVEAGRQRWKIENEGFNTQKNSKLALEHKYVRRDFERMKIYYELLQISHMLEQLTLKRKEIREKVKAIKVSIQQLFLDMAAVLRYVPLSQREVRQTNELKLTSYG